MKLKVLGLGLLAILAMSATAVMNAGAETGGHFTGEIAHVLIEGEDELNKTTELFDHHTNKGIKCDKNPTYTGTITTSTVTQVTLTPNYSTEKECTDLEGHAVHVRMNSCDYLFTVNKKPETTDNTVHLVCPDNKAAEIEVTTGLNPCIITVEPNQTPTGGVAYKTIGAAGSTHGITAEVTITGIHLLYHGGFFRCGVADTTTSKVGTLNGSVLIAGYNTEAKQVGITATGP